MVSIVTTGGEDKTPRYRLSGKGLEAIRKGEFLPSPITKTEYVSKHFEMNVAVGTDYSFRIIVDEDTIRENDDWFVQMN
jgi:hypothetical protein